MLKDVMENHLGWALYLSVEQAKKLKKTIIINRRESKLQKKKKTEKNVTKKACKRHRIREKPISINFHSQIAIMTCHLIEICFSFSPKTSQNLQIFQAKKSTVLIDMQKNIAKKNFRLKNQMRFQKLS
jgi:hypothetical protein